MNSYRYIYITILLIVASAFITLYIQDIYWKMALLFSLFIISILFFRKEIMELKDYALSFVRK